MTSLTSFWYLYCYLSKCFTHGSAVSIIDSEQVHVDWVNATSFILFSVWIIHVSPHLIYSQCRSSHREVFLGKGVLKICNWATLLKSHFGMGVLLQSNFIEIALRQGCSPVNLLQIFRTPFLKNTSGGLLLSMVCSQSYSHPLFHISYIQSHFVFSNNIKSAFFIYIQLNLIYI